MNMNTLVMLLCVLSSLGCAPGRSERPPANRLVGAVEVDTCALVTKEDAEAILGQTVGDAQQGDLGGGTSCTYHTVSKGRGRDFGVLTVIVRPDAQTSVETFKLLASLKKTAKPVDGIGDYAYVSGNSIFVLKNKAEITLETDGAFKKVSIEALTSVAKRIAGKFE